VKSSQSLWMSLVLVASLLRAPAAMGMDSPAPFDHSVWDRLLSTYVDSEGRVAYKRLQETDAVALQSYLGAIATAEPDTWAREEQIAFWLDAYNAGMWAAVLEGKSAESLIGRGRLFKSYKFRAAGAMRTPDEIEHEILRKRFAEPRIHFALVCVSTSCPRLRREAYVGSKLAGQLDDQARLFIGDPKRNVIDPGSRKILLSRIFDWFHSDFESAAGSVRTFIAPYVAEGAIRDHLVSESTEIGFLDYDWSLNAQPNQRPVRPGS
jgi:uncharacterized protein DUF547